MKRTILFVITIFAISTTICSQTINSEQAPKQFLYLLRLEKSMLDSSAWTPEKSKVVQRHFAYLQKLLADGKLIVAGRTQVEDSKTFGIVIFESENFETAQQIAHNDPAVKEKIMTVEVFPYQVALMKRGE